MKLDEAIAASTVQAAGLPAVEDIIRCKNGTTWWWVQTRYIQRDKPLSDTILDSDAWHPIQPIRPRARQ